MPADMERAAETRVFKADEVSVNDVVVEADGGST
jgi:hypothetical protein